MQMALSWFDIEINPNISGITFDELQNLNTFVSFCDEVSLRFYLLTNSLSYGITAPIFGWIIPFVSPP